MFSAVHFRTSSSTLTSFCPFTTDETASGSGEQWQGHGTRPESSCHTQEGPTQVSPQKPRKPLHGSSKSVINVNVELWTPRFPHHPKDDLSPCLQALPPPGWQPPKSSQNGGRNQLCRPCWWSPSLHHHPVPWGCRAKSWGKGDAGQAEGCSPSSQFSVKETLSRVQTARLGPTSGQMPHWPPPSSSFSAGPGSSASSGILSRGASPVNFAHPFWQSAQFHYILPFKI